MIKFWKRLSFVFSITVLSLMASSCDAIYDYEGDCEPHYYVRFVYDMNMLYSDAFAAKVNSVDLYVFDAKSGEYVAKYSEAGEALKEEGYRMALDLNPGDYDFIAWCGLTDNEDHFTVNNQITMNHHAECVMSRSSNEEGNAVQNANLHSLFHGRLIANLPNVQGEHVYTVKLIKNTNNINISMQHLSQEFNPEDFTISMTAANGYMAHDNSLKEDDEITYFPWVLRAGSAQTGVRADGITNFMQAEIATSRLTTDQNPVITITDNTNGNTVFSIPITKWALQLRSMNYKEMGEQEYLDREDEFNVMLYLDNKDEEGWYAASILINGWHVIDNNLSSNQQ